MFKKSEIVGVVRNLNLGSSVAELDGLLESARVETSVFAYLLNDKVDLIPGTKGSGKSALFRMFVDFLPSLLLKQNKVVIAHGIEKQGDIVFHAYKDQFEILDEDEFVSFWCIYLVSLAHEQFVKGKSFQSYLKGATQEVDDFRRACSKAGIPEIKAKKSLSEILAWTLSVLKRIRPKLTYKLPGDGGELGLDLLGNLTEPQLAVTNGGGSHTLPTDISNIRIALEKILQQTRLNLWLMVDRLDEIFPRRSDMENRALRGQLKSLRYFSSDLIRVKIFLRDDILEQIVSSGQGFTALTHVTARQADTLRWSEDQILTMIVKRIYANEHIADFLHVNSARLNASLDYRREAFYKIFPKTVHRGKNQSTTLGWIYSHTKDGRGVVTPRDVIDLLIKARQKEQDDLGSDPTGDTDWLIGASAIIYGHSELSIRKRTTYLQAEFPHLWEDIKKFIGGKTEYDDSALHRVLGKNWERVAEHLISIGLISKSVRRSGNVYWFPFLYRRGLDLSQGSASA